MTLRTRTTLAAVALTVASIGNASAHDAAADDGRLCNTVIDGESSPLLTGNGRLVVHGDTYDCPQPEPVVAVVTPAPEPPKPEVIASISGDVAFDLNKATLKPEFKFELDQIIATLKESPKTDLEIVGHTDSTGTEDYNQGLSERRAQAVADYLEQNGISSNRFTAFGRGESDPVASNSTREGRAKNRRVDIQG